MTFKIMALSAVLFSIVAGCAMKSVASTEKLQMISAKKAIVSGVYLDTLYEEVYAQPFSVQRLTERSHMLVGMMGCSDDSAVIFNHPLSGLVASGTVGVMSNNIIATR